jgi:hypothetical protein
MKSDDLTSLMEEVHGKSLDSSLPYPNEMRMEQYQKIFRGEFSIYENSLSKVSRKSLYSSFNQSFIEFLIAGNPSLSILSNVNICEIDDYLDTPKVDIDSFTIILEKKIQRYLIRLTRIGLHIPEAIDRARNYIKELFYFSLIDNFNDTFGMELKRIEEENKPDKIMLGIALGSTIRLFIIAHELAHIYLESEHYPKSDRYYSDVDSGLLSHITKHSSKLKLR